MPCQSCSDPARCDRNGVCREFGFAPYPRSARAAPILASVMAPRDPLPAETAQPMFVSHVGRCKWEQLQGDGYRMQHIYFVREDGVRGSIDPCGKVLWEPASRTQEDEIASGTHAQGSTRYTNVAPWDESPAGMTAVPAPLSHEDEITSGARASGVDAREEALRVAGAAGPLGDPDVLSDGAGEVPHV